MHQDEKEIVIQNVNQYQGKRVLQPATIKIFLVKGSPNSLRTAEISNWTGKAIAAPRSELGEFLNREEVKSSGIYFLTGVDPDSGEPALYIGEAESVSNRIKNHADKDFWIAVTTFVSKDDNLTKAHIKYLEGYLIQAAKEQSSVMLMNCAASGAKLPESDKAEMDIFLSNIFQLLPILGINHFRNEVEKPAANETILYCKIKGLEAMGKRTSNGFMVFKDSEAVLELRKSAKSQKAKREELIQRGVLAIEEKRLVFKKDFEFSSPSMAAGVVRGGSTNGLKNWKDNKGTSLKKIEENI